MTNIGRHNIAQKSKDRATRTPLKTGRTQVWRRQFLFHWN